jgi:hypothetical protein
MLRSRTRQTGPRSLALARLFDLPDRLIAASIVLYIGLGIIIAIAVLRHWKAGASVSIC